MASTVSYNLKLDGATRVGRSRCDALSFTHCGCSSVGRAQRCQRCCRGFESHHPLFSVCLTVDRSAQMNMPESERSDDNQGLDSASVESPAEAGSVGTMVSEESAPRKQRLALEVSVTAPSACIRHVSITVPREDVERYFQEAFGELQPRAEVPGFRAGRAPRKIVEARFRERIADQVKSTLIMDSLSQVTEEAKFSPIGEPDLDLEDIQLSGSGPLAFEFDIEVRPEFDLPAWQGLKLRRAVHEFEDSEIDQHVNRVLRARGDKKLVDGPIESDDLLALTIESFHEGRGLLLLPVADVEIQPNLSFVDSKLEGFDKLVVGKKVGDVVETVVKLSDSVENSSLRGAEVQVKMTIDSVQRVQLPALTPGFLDRIGGFEDEQDLRLAIREELERRFQFQQAQGLRRQIVESLIAGVDMQLPEALLRRQTRREMERIELQLRADGLSDEFVQSVRNGISQNALNNTARMLKEHFILERIADEMQLEADPQDYELEVARIAAQGDESPRRVRARLEKRGQMDVLRNQIVERKVIELIQGHATIEDVEVVPVADNSVSMNFALAGVSSQVAPIPEAKYTEPSVDQLPGSKT